MNRCYQCTKPTRREWLGGLGAWAALHALTRRGDAQVKMLEVQPRATARQLFAISMVRLRKRQRTQSTQTVGRQLPVQSTLPIPVPWSFLSVTRFPNWVRSIFALQMRG